MPKTNIRGSQITDGTVDLVDISATGSATSSTYLRGDWTWATPGTTSLSYVATIGDGVSTSFPITHNLGSRDVYIEVYDTTTYATVFCDRVRTSTTVVTLTFATAPATNAYRVVIVGGASATGITASQISDSTAAGRSVVTGTNVSSNVVMTEVFDSSKLNESATLPASSDFMANQQLEIGSTSVLEIPSTSTLEVYTYVPPTSVARTAYVATTESSTSAAYTDLTTTTDQVTVTIGSNGLAIVMISCQEYTNAVNTRAFMSFALSGANIKSPSVDYAIGVAQAANTSSESISGTFLLTNLTPGPTTFKAKYAAEGGVLGTWAFRTISVYLPL